MSNREKIIKIALDLFSSAGYDAVGIQEVVDKAGITKPTLYHYFGSKGGLLETILKQHFDLLIESVKTAADYKGDLPKNLYDVAETFFVFAQKHKTFYRMQLAMVFTLPDSEPRKAVSKHNEELFSIIEEMFRLASANHGNMKSKHVRYAFTYIGMINNYLTLYLNGYIKLDEETIRQVVHQFSHGIYS